MLCQSEDLNALKKIKLDRYESNLQYFHLTPLFISSLNSVGFFYVRGEQTKQINEMWLLGLQSKD